MKKLLETLLNTINSFIYKLRSTKVWAFVFIVFVMMHLDIKDYIAYTGLYAAFVAGNVAQKKIVGEKEE